MRYSIGIDIGTTTVKCILFKEGPEVVAEASEEYETVHVKPSWVQQNPDSWWDGVVKSIRALLRKSQVHPRDIRVISVSSQAPAVLPVDREGRPLHDALIWMDRRSKNEYEYIRSTIGEKKVFDITGNRLDTYFTMTELMWFLKNRPQLMERCHKVLQVNGYINLRLTGVFSINMSHASITQLYDIRKNCWSRELLDAIGADLSLMPDIYECGEPLGTVSKEAAEQTGLSTETVVLAGMVDATATGLEVGVDGSGQVAEMTGTSSVVLFGFDRLVTEENLSYLRGYEKGSTILYGAMNTAGGSLKWFRDALYGGETEQKDSYDRINREIEAYAKEPSRIIFLPYLEGERAPIWDPDARGMFMGLTMNSVRADLMRAIMEGACFALQDNLDQAVKAGIPIRDIICCGGCSKSDIWLKIKASIIQKEIKLPVMNLGAPGGLSYVNAAYMGEYASVREAAQAGFRIKRTVEPVQEWIEPYQEMYRIYLDSYQALKAQFAALARI